MKDGASLALSKRQLLLRGIALAGLWSAGGYVSPPATAEARQSTASEQTDAWRAAGLPIGGPDQMRAAFTTAIQEGLIAGGALQLMKRDQVIFREGFGVADIAARRPFTPRTVAHLASTSKPHTATLIMILVDEGLIDLDAPCSTYAPEIVDLAIAGTGERATPTMRQLLSHTAGFEGLARMGYDAMTPLIFRPSSFAGASAAIARQGLAYKPGTDYRYTQLGFVIAADIAERVTKRPWEELFQDRLARPIGAAASTWYPSSDTLATMATRYRRAPEGLKPIAPRAARAQGLPIDPAGSLVSDIDGVARLFLLHLNGGVANGRRLISQRAIKHMWDAQPAAPGYGLGLNRRWMPTDGTAAIINHGGAFGTVGWADMETGVIGALFVQHAPPLPVRWQELIYTAMAQAGVGRMTRYMGPGGQPSGG